MKEKIVKELIDECSRLLETIPTEQLSVWSIFANINSIASQYDNVDCLIHVNFANGSATQGMCILESAGRHGSGRSTGRASSPRERSTGFGLN